MIGLAELITIAAVIFINSVVASLLFRDARKRGLSDLATLIFVLLAIFMFPLGLVLYLVYILGRSSRKC